VEEVFALDSGEWATRVRACLREGSVTEAEALINRALARAPDDPSAWYFRGVVANRRRDHATAIAALSKVVAAVPGDALPWLALGTALARSEHLPDAEHAYRRAVVLQPTWADAHYNLGMLRKRSGARLDAMRSLHAAWRCDATLFVAAAQCVATIADAVLANAIDAPWASDEDEAPRPTICVVCCSIDDDKRRQVERLYANVFRGYRCEIVSVANARSLASAYNAAVARTAAEIVVLSHDDIDIVAPDFAARLVHALSEFDVVGVIGTTRSTGPAVGWAGHPHLRGWITHRTPPEHEWCVDVLDSRPCAAGVTGLDGVLLAARRDVLAAVPFDARTFDGFHLYDLDWSLRAARAGFRLGVRGDLLVVHASRGRYDATWQRHADRFNAKHACGREAPAASSFFGARLDSAAQALRFFSVLCELARGDGARLRPLPVP
jgi:hypothetical protein